MAYQRKHKYTSRQERYHKIKRNTKMIILFSLIAIIVLIYRNWIPIVDFFRIHF